jgi:hypothetical protein
MRCASPPDSVSALRPSVRYSRPTFAQELQPLADLLQDGAGNLFGSDADADSSEKNASASATLMSTICRWTGRPR